MAFQWFTIVFGWAAFFLFVVLAAYKIHRFATMPLNLRWEVYPVPHEAGDKRLYGGSYMEEVDWAKKPRPSSPLAEWAEMGSEIFFLKRVREHNPYHIWPLSLALHWGLYLLILWMGLLAATVFVPVMAFLTMAVGISAFVLGACGAVGLIVIRATDKTLALYTAPIDYFHLVFLAAIFGVGLFSWWGDPLFSLHHAYVKSLLFFRPTPLSPAVLSLFLLLQLFAIYMPFSKLIHYLMKHFTFHEILWNDEFKVKGSSKDKQIDRQLSSLATWAGPHIAPGKTWREQVRGPSAGEDQEK
jgi:nitrate reductase gamma subunit